MRVLGIDPGLGITGYGIVDVADSDTDNVICPHRADNVTVIEAGVIRSNDSLPLAERLSELADELGNVIAEYRPEVVAVDELYSHYGHPKTALIMGHARGVIFLKAAEAGLEVVPYAATRIKKSLTGNGRATKGQMQAMIKSTLGLSAVPEPPDIADALAVALCHCRAKAHNVVVQS